MSVIVPQFGIMPNPSSQTQAQYDAAWENFHAKIDPFAAALTALGAEAEINSVNSAVSAANAAAAVDALANAVWVSGTSYTAGQVRYSPIDFYSYRRKTNGAGTTDPSQDPANWALQTKNGAGGAGTTSSATDVALTSLSGRLQIISMTAAGKKTTLPSAATLDKGSPVFVICNAGQYRFSVHKYGGVFICYLNPGQIAAFSLSDNSGAGVWQVNGQDVERIYSGNNAEVLNAVDSRNIAVAMTTATQAVCAFRNNSTGYLNAVVLNYGSASGSPAQVTALTAKDISIAAQKNNQVTIIWKKDTGETQAVVLDILTSTTFSAGTVDQLSTGTTGTIGTSVCALSSTQLLACYQPDSGGLIKERVLDISGSTIAKSAEVSADGFVAGSVAVKKISSTKALIALRGVGNLYFRLQSVTGSTPAPSGSLLNLSMASFFGGANMPLSQYGLVVLSTSRAVVFLSPDRSYADMVVVLIDISGSSPVLLRTKPIRLGAIGVLSIAACALDANTAYVTFVGGGSLGVDAMIVKLTADDQIITSPLSDKTEPAVTAADNYLACDALDSAHVMQVSRNAATFISAKTVEIGL